MQRALMQFFKPENYFMVREALLKAGRGDLIGNGCDCLIPAHPPRQAIEARRRQANGTAEGEYVHQIPNPESSKGYRPGARQCAVRTRSANGKSAVQARDRSQQLTALSNASGSPRMFVKDSKQGSKRLRGIGVAQVRPLGAFVITHPVLDEFHRGLREGLIAK